MNMFLYKATFALENFSYSCDEAGRYAGIPLAFMSYAQRRGDWLVLAILLAKAARH